MSQDLSLPLCFHDTKFDPPCEVTWSDLNTTPKIITIILSSAHNCKYKVRLTQILALEAFGNFVDNWTENEIEQNVQHHVSPITFIRARSANTEEDDNKKTNEDGTITQEVVQENSASVILHHQGAQVDGVAEVTVCHFLSWQGRSIESSLGVY